LATKESIQSAIQAKVGLNYHAYRMGLTHDLAERKAYWKDVKKQDITYWSDWPADSLSDAKDVESHFIDRGMKGAIAEQLSACKTVHVYVF